MKRKATGIEGIADEDRIYLCVKFCEPYSNVASSRGDCEYIFVSKYQIIAEMLKYAMDTFASRVPLTNSSGDKMALVLSTEDTPDWTAWDRSAPLYDSLSNFEEVYVRAMPLTLVVQSQIEKQIQQQAAKSELPAPSPSAAVVPAPLAKGDAAWYRYQPPSESAPRLVRVVVLGVHHDDFPHVYYTVSSSDSPPLFREKQTDADRLLPLSEHVPAAEEASTSSLTVRGRPLMLRAQHGERSLGQVAAGSDNTVQELRQLLLARCGLPACRLLCKGTQLKDPLTLQQAKLSSGCKVLVVAGGK